MAAQSAPTAPLGAAPPSADASGGSDTAASPLLATWTRGDEYRELVRSRIRSQKAVDGFGDVTPLEAYAAAESFKAWDVDRDGVLSRDEFSKVLELLADRPLDDETLRRLFKLVDVSEAGEIDFNAWLYYFRQLGRV